MKVLVTGGNGFLGYHTVMRLMKEEHAITVVDYHTGDLDKVKQNKINFVQIGAEDPKCERLFSDTLFDIVIHLAYKTPAKASGDFDMQNLHVNHASLNNILFLSLKYHVRKVVILSSFAIYGQQDKLLIAESAWLHPLDLPGYHDMSRENQCQEYRQLGLNVVVLRTGYIIGPRQDSNLETALRTLLRDPFTSGESVVHDKLDCLYVGDFVEAVINLMTRETPSVLNISSGIGISKKDMVRCIRETLDETYAGSPIDKEDQSDNPYRLKYHI